MKALLGYCEPNYQMPTGKTVQSHLMNLYDVEKVKMVDKFKEFNQLPAVTCDAWTNMQKVGFFSIMIHYINVNWEMKVYNWSSPKIEGRHTAVNLSSVVNEELAKAGFNLVMCITHDTAANMCATVNASNTKYSIGCLAHILALAVNESIEGATEANKVVQKIHKCVATVRKRETFSREFRKVRDSLIPEKRTCELKLSVSTRWNSIFIMVESFKNLFIAFSTSTRKPGVLYPDEKDAFTFSSYEEKVIDDVLAVLNDCKMATDIWEGQKYVTISCVFPILFRIVDKVSAIDCLTDAGQDLRDTLVTNLLSRFSLTDDEYLTGMSVHTIASFLDPRFKDLSFLGAELHYRIHNTVAEEMEHVEILSTSDETTEQQGNGPKVSKLSKLMGESVSTSVDEPQVTGVRMRSIVDELTAYKNEAKEDLDCDPLAWWKLKAVKYPRISVIARRYLQIPATSASSERLFSSYGNIYTERRMSLRADTAEATLFMHFNH